MASKPPPMSASTFFKRCRTVNRAAFGLRGGADELYPDSWCSECEAMVNAVGEWDDETEAKAGISLICSVCYERARDLNQSTETGQKQ